MGASESSVLNVSQGTMVGLGRARLQGPGQIWCDGLGGRASNLKLLSWKRKSSHILTSTSVSHGSKAYRPSYSKLAQKEDHLNENLHFFFKV